MQYWSWQWCSCSDSETAVLSSLSQLFESLKSNPVLALPHSLNTFKYQKPRAHCTKSTGSSQQSAASCSKSAVDCYSGLDLKPLCFCCLSRGKCRAFMSAISSFPSLFALFYVPQPAITLTLSPSIIICHLLCSLPHVHRNKVVRVCTLPIVIDTNYSQHSAG